MKMINIEEYVRISEVRRITKFYHFNFLHLFSTICPVLWRMSQKSSTQHFLRDLDKSYKTVSGVWRPTGCCSGICLDSLCAQPVAALLNVGESTSSCSSAQKDRRKIGASYILYYELFFHFTVLVSIIIIKYIYIYIILYIHTSDSVIYIYWLQNTYIETCPYNCPCSLISDNIFGSFLVGSILHAFMEDCQSLGTWHNVYTLIYIYIYLFKIYMSSEHCIYIDTLTFGFIASLHICTHPWPLTQL